MTGDDLRKIFLGRTLFRLDTILSPRLIPVLYITGLTAILLWAVAHLFATFGRNFGDGLWGLLEIAVFGVLAIVVLRIACEALLVHFKANEVAARTVSLSRVSTSLIEEVREAISDIADEEEDDAVSGTNLPAEVPPPRKRTTRRPAKRKPPAPTQED